MTCQLSRDCENEAEVFKFQAGKRLHVCEACAILLDELDEEDREELEQTEEERLANG